MEKMIAWLKAKFEPLVVSLLVLVGGYFRFAGLSKDPLWFDETIIWKIASFDNYKTMLLTNAGSNSAPPLYVLLLSLVEPLTTNEVGLRIISFASGVLAIAAFYYLLRQFMDLPGTIAGTLLLAMSPQNIFYSHELREYSLMVLFTSLVFLAYHRYITTQSKRALLWFTVFSVVGLYTQYGIALVLLGLGLNTLVYIAHNQKWKDRKLWLGLSAYLVALGISAVGVWQSALKYQLEAGGFEKGSYLGEYYWDGSLSEFFNFVFTGTTQMFDFAYLPLMSALLFVFAVWGGLQFWGEKQGRQITGTFLFPWLVAIGLGLASLYPYGGLRQNLFLTLIIFLFAARGLQALFRAERRVYYLIVALLFLVSWGFNTQRLNNWSVLEDMPLAVNELCEVLEEDDRVYVSSDAIYAFEYYWERCDLSQHAAFTLFTEDSSIWMAGPHEVMQEYPDTRIWLVTMHLSGQEVAHFNEIIEVKTGRTPAEVLYERGVTLFVLADVP